MSREKIILCWSGGKDSTFTLYELKKSGRYEVIALLTTVTAGYDRISMHGVRRVLLEAQAAALGIQLEKVFISKDASNQEYETKMEEVLKRYQSQGIRSAAFGDIFLEDLRKYREANLAKIGMRGLFPIWKRDTKELARKFIDLGFKAVITCVDSNHLNEKFVGRIFDHDFVSDLPPTADPCGENGEFHSFVYDGPIFQKSVSFTKGEVVFRDNRFYFCDLIPTQETVSV